MLREYVKPFAGVITVKLDENISSSAFTLGYNYSANSGSSCYDDVQDFNLGEGLSFEKMRVAYNETCDMYNNLSNDINDPNFMTYFQIYKQLTGTCKIHL